MIHNCIHCVYVIYKHYDHTNTGQGQHQGHIMLQRDYDLEKMYSLLLLIILYYLFITSFIILARFL